MDFLFGKCPYVTSQVLISGKWSIIILHHIEESGTLRFGELLKLLHGITQTTLTKQLRILEKHKLINRKVYPEVPPKVEYSLTEIGSEFKYVLEAYHSFGEKYINFINETNAAK